MDLYQRVSPDEENFSNRQQKQTDFRNDLKEKGKDYSYTGRDTIVREVDRFSNIIHDAASKLHEQNDYFAGYAEDFANRIDSASRHLKEKEPNELLSEAKDFSSKNPYLTVGGMFAAGLALSRFLKAGTNVEKEQGGSDGLV